MKLRKLGLAVLAGMALVAAWPGPGHALSLHLSAASPLIPSIGETLSLDLRITEVKGSDGGGTLRGYDLVVEFDSGVFALTPGDITLNLTPFGGDPSVIVDNSVVGGDSANVAVFVSVLTLDDNALRSLQTDDFLIAQLQFTTVGAPLQTTISFGSTVLTGLDGFSDPLSGARAHTKSALVLVPEASAAVLVLLGLVGLPASRRIRNRRSRKPYRAHRE